MITKCLFILSTIVLMNSVFAASPRASQECQSQRVKLQMLGTRGPELLDNQASTSYLIWLDNKARVIIDAGSGSLQRFKQSKADFKDVDIMLFSHFHVDHSADFSAYIKGAFFTDRSKDLTIFGPTGTKFVTSAKEFVQRSIGNNGLYPYLERFLALDQPSHYKINVKNIPWSFDNLNVRTILKKHHKDDKSGKDDIHISTVSTHHGPFPSQGYRIELAGCSITFSGDMSGRFGGMSILAKNSDIWVAHNAINEDATGIAANLHMTPTMIGKIAKEANVKKVLLTHLMKRSLSVKPETLKLIKKNYKGAVSYPKDLDIIHP